MMKLAWLYWETEWSEDYEDTGDGHWVFKAERDDYRGDDSKWKRIVYCEVEE